MLSQLRSPKPSAIPLPPHAAAKPRRRKVAGDATACPALTLILGPAGAGKTEWTLNRCIAAASDDSRALLIVSSPQQALTRAEQIAARLQCAPEDAPVSILTFRQLITNLADSLSPTEATSLEFSDANLTENQLEGAAENADEAEDAPVAPSFRPIGRAFQRMALSDLFLRAIQPDDFLGRMRRAPGFVPALAERLREWKLACLTPALLEEFGPAVAAELADPTFTRKTAELARLFRAYETFLTRNHLRDEEDILRAAIAGVRSGAARLPAEITCVLVDGFYRFNPMQRLLLAALAQQTNAPGTDELGTSVEVVVTLPYEERRPLLFAAPARTLTLLRQEFACRETVLDYRPPARPAALARLSDSLFGDAAQSNEETRGQEEAEKSSSAFSASLSLFDAPNPYVEAEMVARQFRRLYDAGGYVWSDFAVILRAMGDYAPILAAVFERHGIPLGVDGPEVLAENPFIKTLLSLLAVLRRGWQRDDVLAFLKSSYTAPDRLEADGLRRRARQSGVREGRERWLALIEEDSAAATLHDMAHYDALLTRERKDPREFAALIEESVAFFGLDERIALGEPTRQERDRSAWSAARETLQALAQMAALSGRGADDVRYLS